MKYKISELASLFGLHASTIRYYDKHNMLPFVQRDENGERYVDSADMSSFSLICFLKDAGCSLHEISDIVALAECCKNSDDEASLYTQILSHLNSHMDDLFIKQEEILNQLRMTKYLQWYFNQCEKEDSSLIFCKEDAPIYNGTMPKMSTIPGDNPEYIKEVLTSYLDKYGKTQ